MKTVAIIPARYKSSRFPGKPLVDILGKPMIWWVYHQAGKAKLVDEVYVATDDKRIADVCDNYEIPVIMTAESHRNGSERLSEVADKIEADIYVTVQGDEPLLEPGTIDRVINVIMEKEDTICATLKTPYRNPVDVINKTTPKVVTDLDDNILLFTRAAVPYPKAALDYIIYKPIGVYAFKREILRKYKTLPMGPLERAEEIELLRLLENGYKIKIKEIDSETIAVDTPKDLERVINIIKARRERVGEI